MLAIRKKKESNDNKDDNKEKRLIIYRNLEIWFPKMLIIPQARKINFELVPYKNLHYLKSIVPECRAIQDKNEYQPIILKYLIYKNCIEKMVQKNIPSEIWSIILEYLFNSSILDDYEIYYNQKKKILRISDIRRIFRNNYYLFPYLQYLPS